MIQQIRSVAILVICGLLSLVGAVNDGWSGCFFAVPFFAALVIQAIRAGRKVDPRTRRNRAVALARIATIIGVVVLYFLRVSGSRIVYRVIGDEIVFPNGPELPNATEKQLPTEAVKCIVTGVIVSNPEFGRDYFYSISCVDAAGREYRTGTEPERILGDLYFRSDAIVDPDVKRDIKEPNRFQRLTRLLLPYG